MHVWSSRSVVKPRPPRRKNENCGGKRAVKQDWPNAVMAKFGLAKYSRIRMAKSGLANEGWLREPQPREAPFEAPPLRPPLPPSLSPSPLKLREGGAWTLLRGDPNVALFFPSPATISFFLHSLGGLLVEFGWYY